MNHRRAVAATILTSLAVVEVNKATIGSYPHAIQALVSLFRVRNTREQKEAAMAIFALCSFLDNRRRILNCGSVPILIRIANLGLERADEVLGLLAKWKEGREEMVNIFHDCVQVLVHVLRNRSSRGVQYTLLTLNSLCSYCRDTRLDVLREGVFEFCVGFLEDDNEKVRRNASGLIQVLPAKRLMC